MPARTPMAIWSWVPLRPKYCLVPILRENAMRASLRLGFGGTGFFQSIPHGPNQPGKREQRKKGERKGSHKDKKKNARNNDPRNGDPAGFKRPASRGSRNASIGGREPFIQWRIRGLMREVRTSSSRRCRAAGPETESRQRRSKSNVIRRRALNRVHHHTCESPCEPDSWKMVGCFPGGKRPNLN